MTSKGEKFAQLLTEAIYRARFHENRSIMAIQDELGYALGKVGGSAVEYWRKGHIPPNYSEVEQLARELVERGGLSNREELEAFLRSAGCLGADTLCTELFSDKPNQDFQIAGSPRPHAPTRIEHPDPTPVGELAPFVVGPPITHPRQFFGREAELRRIFDLWKRFPLQNVALIGPHRSGKTSLLHYLRNITTAPQSQLRPGQRVDWLPDPQRYRWIMVDFQDIRMCSQEGLLRHLLMNLNLSVPEPCDLHGFMDTVSHQLRAPTLVLLDEIGAALACPALDQQFWWSLRSLASNLAGGNLGFLLTAPAIPAQLAHEYGKPSPFFNIFGHTLTLGPLNEQESRELINSSPILFPVEDVEWILAQSKCWPALLQIFCHTRLMYLENGKIDDTWKEDGQRQSLPYQHLLENK